MDCPILGCADPAHAAEAHRADLLAAIGVPLTEPPPRLARPRTPKPQFARRRRPVARTCRNCRGGSHGRWCCASLFGPACPCRCWFVLGLDGPFTFGDPTAPDTADAEVA
jgi:hypothetical protein